MGNLDLAQGRLVRWCVISKADVGGNELSDQQRNEGRRCRMSEVSDADHVDK